MSFILSLDTSTPVCSVAIHQDGNLLAVTDLFVEKSHSSMLAVIIKNILEQNGLKANDLDAVAVSKGPGSYTGLRIGTSTAKGLCFALDIPLISVNTLAAMANEVSLYNVNESLLCPMLDARRMEVYYLIADQHNNIIEDTGFKVLDESSFNDFLVKKSIIFFGNGSVKFKKIKAHPKAFFIEGIDPSARYVGELAWQKFQIENYEDLAYFEPLYLKEFKTLKPNL